MKVYLDDIEINFRDLTVTNFVTILENEIKLKKENNLDFISIKNLKGSKELLNKTFIDTFDECITY